MVYVIELLAIVPPDNKVSKRYTAYLFNQDTQVILPIKLPMPIAELLVATLGNIQTYTPHIYDTINRLISLFKGNVSCVRIYLFKENIFYAYIRIRKGKSTYDINTSIYDALGIAIKCKAPILIEDNILYKCGFTLTKEAVSQALAND